MEATDEAGDGDRAPARVVRKAWAEVFQLEDVSADQHFIDLGGDSLTAKRLIASIESELGCRIPFRTILDAPTLEELTARVEQICGAD